MTYSNSDSPTPHPRTRPVDDSAVLEDDTYKRDAEEREAAHDFGPRHGQHRGRQRIGDLILDHLRSLTRVFRIDDYLGVGEIRNGVERQMDQRVDSGRGGESGAEDDQEQVAGRPGDQARDHCDFSPLSSPLSAALRLLSASIRKFAETTTFSFSASPSLISIRPSPRRWTRSGREFLSRSRSRYRHTCPAAEPRPG